MGLKELIHKKRIVSNADMIIKEIQKVDAWLMSEASIYELYFDATVPMQPSRSKYIEESELREKYNIYNKKLKRFIEEHFYVSGNMEDLYILYQFVERALITVFQMVFYAPSRYILYFVNYNEAVSYYNNVFVKTKELCKTISYNIEQIKLEMLEIVFLDGYQKEENENYVMYEDGVKKIKDCNELEQCEKLFRMLAECSEYIEYLFAITSHIYEHVPYIIDAEGNYREIKNWKKTQENIIRHIDIENIELGIATDDEFLQLIE